MPLRPFATRVRSAVRQIPVDHPASSETTEETDHVRRRPVLGGDEGAVSRYSKAVARSCMRLIAPSGVGQLQNVRYAEQSTAQVA